MSGLSPYCISERRNPSFLIRRFLSYHGWLIKVWYVGIWVSIDWHRPSLINSSKSETPNSNGSTDDSGTEPDSETTERVLSCPSKQTPNKEPSRKGLFWALAGVPSPDCPSFLGKVSDQRAPCTLDRRQQWPTSRSFGHSDSEVRDSRGCLPVTGLFLLW